jgi:hypothetical protein
LLFGAWSSLKKRFRESHGSGYVKSSNVGVVSRVVTIF